MKEKKKECRKKFGKENEEKDPWEVVKWAKDSGRIREVMKTFRGVNNNLRNMDEEKAEDFISDHFVWNEETRTVDKKEETGAGREIEEGALEKMVTKVEIALSGTTNSSALRIDSVSYRFIEVIKYTILGEKLLEEVA